MKLEIKVRSGANKKIFEPHLRFLHNRVHSHWCRANAARMMNVNMALKEGARLTDLAC